MLTNFLKSIFTWWNNQTVGTFLFTLFYGKKVGEDQFGNEYYKNLKDTKRWVIYKNEIEASKIPPEWHMWIHKTVISTPDKTSLVDYPWIKPHHENLTGSDHAYHPKKITKEKKENYKKWLPD